MRTLIALCFRIVAASTPRAAALVIRICRRVFSPEINLRLFVPILIRSRGKHPPKMGFRSLGVSAQLPLRGEIDWSDYMQVAGFFGGIPPLAGTFMEHATDRSLFIDIGANIGLVSLAMSLRIKGDNIHAIEANPTTCCKLQQQFELNGIPGHVHSVGLSEREGTMTMAIVGHDTGSNSLEASRFEGETTWHGKKVQAQRIEVTVTTFDQFCGDHIPIDSNDVDRVLIKIDVEGHEMAVLRGMQSFLQNSRKPTMVIVEVENGKINDVSTLMIGHGFSQHRPFWNPTMESRPHHTDLVFKRGLP